MLRLTKKADYGLMALKFLAEHANQASLSAKDIAEAYHIPPQLLAKILQRLAKVGILRSHAGMNGGYSLLKKRAKSPPSRSSTPSTGPSSSPPADPATAVCDLTASCTIKEPLARVND